MHLKEFKRTLNLLNDYLSKLKDCCFNFWHNSNSMNHWWRPTYDQIGVWGWWYSPNSSKYQAGAMGWVGLWSQKTLGYLCTYQARKQIGLQFCVLESFQLTRMFRPLLDYRDPGHLSLWISLGWVGSVDFVSSLSSPPPEDIQQCLGIFGCHSWGGGLPLAFSGYIAGTVLKTLLCADSSPLNKCL